MKPLNKTASKVLAALTEGLEVGDARKIDNTEGTFMPVHVDRVGINRYAVAHYFEQNGDLCPDPDMEFIKLDKETWAPVAITQVWGGYRKALELDENGDVSAIRPRELRAQTEFANMWMNNIKFQQGGLKALRN